MVNNLQKRRMNQVLNLNGIIKNLLQNNPYIANNPRAASMIKIIESGDSVKGEELANNLCQTYGLSREEALHQAKEYFSKNFPNML